MKKSAQHSNDHTAYILSSDVEEDLRKITQYTLKNHGRRQTIKYRDQLESCANNLALETYPRKVLSGNKPTIFYIRCQHHYIFGIRKEKIVIIAILHERMDIINRISDRL